MKPILSVKHLSKKFGTLPVIQNVSFDIHPGEVVGITGSIGSGKSVLIMLLAGLYAPDNGEMVFDGRKIKWPFAAHKTGIGVIHQRPTLDEQLNIVDNIFLGNEISGPRGFGWLQVLNTYKMHAEAERILNQLGLDSSLVNEKVSNLSGELRQMIAIGRVLAFPLKLVIIDEPTVLLSYPFQQRLLGLIHDWQQQGVSVIFSSNNMDHLFAVTDRILVLQEGRKAAVLRTDETKPEDVVSLILGTEDPNKSIPPLWDFDSSDRIREFTEKLHYHQMLLGKDLAAEATLNKQLTEQLAEQVQELDQTNLALLEAQRRLLSEREAERKHLARELHDQIIQDLLSINYDLEELENRKDLPRSIANNLSESREDIRKLVDDLRRICGDLRPPTIDSLGLGATLQSFTREWTSHTGINVDLDLDPDLHRLPEVMELSIFRIVQEALNNVRKHSQASDVKITLKHTSPRNLMVSVLDNGKGLSENIDLADLALKGHFGLIGMNERVALLGGKFRLQHPPDGGLLVVAEIPHPKVEIVPEMA